MLLTKEYVHDIFHRLEHSDTDAFFQHIHENVEWTVMGAHTFAGTYQGRDSFRNGNYVPLNKDLRDGAIIHVNHIFIDDDTAIVEFRSLPTDYKNKTVANTYCWVLTFDQDHLITKVRAYVDPALMHKMLVDSCN
ncbi:nuclear transport factor 2 family protein [Poriferisphaera sp. WC338]|uniref:nuclear transport factor 2 family protein n=1 Tax=Poriferisphaera sp. WC338 TaxID=3425129 RepID=UPI003D81386D